MTSPTTDIAESRSYWTHGIKDFPSPVAQFRMAQLIDLDDRLYENARVVYRFLIGWYHDGHGDALLSMRHVSKVMRARAPDGATVLSHSVVQRAVIALMDTGWVVRTYKGRGKGKGASRFMPVFNVLELAGQGKFPEPSHCSGTVDGDDELSHSTGTVVSHSNGAVEPELSRSNGPKTQLLDPVIEPGTGNCNDVSGDAAADGLAPTPRAGFEELWIAYGRLGNKVAARAAFEKLVSPDIDHIIARARSWAASARPGQKRMPLERWLALEKFDEADRRVEPKPERILKPSAPKAANSNQPVRVVGGRTDLGAGEHLAEIVSADYADQPNGAAEMKVTLKLASNGEERSHTYFAWHPLDDEREAGQATSRSLVRATGGDPAISDNPDPIGQRVWVIVRGTAVEYRAA